MRAELRARASVLRESMRRTCGRDPVFVIDAHDDLGAVQPRDGDCWCPTPSALATLRALGIEPSPAPTVEVLRRVNHRSFSASLGPALPGARFATQSDEVLRHLRDEPSRRFVLKRALSFAGRSRKILCARDLNSAATTWIAASFTGHGIGLAVEPFVEISADFSLHGLLAGDGSATFGRPVRLANQDGAFASARPAVPGDLAPSESDALHAAGASAADALSRAGYVGPFCIDAFRWRDERGSDRFHPLCEINARYTMAWWIGMEGRLNAD